MNTIKIFILNFLVLISLSNNVSAQSHEVPTGPFRDSTNYVPPPPSFHTLHKPNTPDNVNNATNSINITHYMQFGQSWSSNKLGTCTTLISESGCAMTDAATLLEANSVNVDPGQLNTWLTNNGGYANGCDIIWTAVQNYHGATLTWYGSQTYNISTLKSEIDGGNPVIVHVDRPYGSTSTETCGHFIVVYGYNNVGSSSSDYFVSDPGSSTFPTYLASYSICSEPYPLRIYHNVTSGGGCTIANITPTLVYPGSGSTPGTTISTTTPTLSWNPVTGATNYDVYISIYPYGSSNIVYQQTCVSGSSLNVPSGYMTNGNQYRWDIQANVNCGSCVSQYSDRLYFQISTQYSVNLSSNPSNGGTTSGGGTYNSGSSVTITATPNSGYTFTNWTENGSAVSTSSSYTFTISGNRTLVANFGVIPPTQYSVNLSSNPSNGGTTSGGGTHNSGSSVTITATPNSGYTFTNWTENGSAVSTSSSYTFTINGNRTLVANFAVIPPTQYSVNLSSNPSNGGTTSGGGTYNSGSSATVTATPNSGYTFTNWTVNGSAVSTSSSYTFTINGNRTLVANFAVIPPTQYSVNLSSNPSNGGTTSGGGTYNSGSSATVTATPNSGYTFTNWTENGSAVSTSSSYTFTISGNRTLVANFAVTAPVSTPPTITSFSPTSGPIGTSVTITGTSFNTTPANNIVYFGAVQTQVSSATQTQLVVTVPKGATYQPISITVNGLTAYSNAPFIVTFPSSQIIDTTSFASKLDFTTGTTPYWVAIGDVDGDGKPDIVVVNSNDNTISVFRNTSISGSITASSFASKVDFTTGSNPKCVVIGDVDGDGKPDLVVTNWISQTVSVFRNTSTPGSITASSFAPKVDFTSGGSAQCVAIGDVDGDGKPDLVVTNWGSNTVSVFRNTSVPGSITTNSFAPKVDFPTGSYSGGVAIGDLDGDGKLDFVVTNWGDNSVSVFRNTSTSGSITASSFASKVDFTTGTNPRSVAIGDVDADGKPDLVATNYTSNTISVFKNTNTSGSITASSFASKVDITTGLGPEDVAISDVDGDGKPDLVVANWNGGNVSIFRNTSTSGSITASSFASKVDFRVGESPYNIAIGDVDGDVKPDIVTANMNSSSVSVLRNTVTTNLCDSAIITTQPTNQKATVGGTATFSVSVSGTSPFSYFWYKNGLFQANTTNSSSSTNAYTTPALTASDDGNYYYCLITNCSSTYECHSDNAYLTIITTDVTDYNNRIPKFYSISQNYPNPFNPSTIIRYDLPKEGMVSIKIYDMLGREVKTLVNEYKRAGSYNIEFNASKLTSGIYFYRLISGKFTQTNKLVLLK